MIRESRKAQRLTQEQLAEGICSRETIVKLEKGERKPSWFVFREILHRLGLSTEIFHNEFVSDGEVPVIDIYSKCINLLALRKFDEVYEMINEIEKLKKSKKSQESKMWHSDFGRYGLNRLKSGLYSLDTFPPGGNKYHNPDLGIKYSMKVINITRPGFEIDKIPDYFLAMHEYLNINTIAIAYSAKGDRIQSIKILKMLRANIEKNYSMEIHDYVISWYRNMQTNISITMMKAGMLEECLETAEENLQQNMHTNDLIYYYNNLYCKAYSLVGLGYEEEGRALFKKVLLLVYALDGHSGLDFKSIKQEYEKTYDGATLELCVPW